MATNTSKYLLKKPAYTDTADIGDINDNMDIIDGILFDHAGSIAVICMGNVCGVSVPTGQYVLLQKSMISGRADGLYTAAKAIPANTVIDSSYLTAVARGGLNDLKSVTDTLNNSITSWQSNVNPHKNTYSMEAKNALSNVSQNTWFDIRSVFNAFNDVDFTGIGVIFCRNNAALGLVRAYHPFGENAISTIAIESGKQYDMIIVSV